MALNQSASKPSAGSAGRFRWVTVWLGIGCAIALLLIGNAVRDYTFVSRVLATQQVRHQLNQINTQVEQQFRRSDGGTKPLESALESTLRDDESVTLRDADGVEMEHLGRTYFTSPFTRDEERHAFGGREPLFRTVATPAGNIVVEVFALRAFRRPGVGPPQPPPPPTAAGPSAQAGPGPGGPRFLTLEVALPLTEADTSILTPIRRNLVINLAAALTLLATVLLAAVGLRSYAKGRVLEEQVEIARQVQSRLLPDPALQVQGVQIATIYKPSEQVGGDFYDVFPNDANGFAAVIGDVSGKGLPAALLMGVIHGAVRTAVWQHAQAGHEEESARLNQLLCERASDNRFASMFWSSYGSQLRSMRYVNAGHCPPLLVSRRDGKLTTKHLSEGGPVLGLLPQATYDATTVDVAPGDLLVMFSDGLVEAANAANEEYGEGRLQELLYSHFDETPDHIRDLMMSSWTSFSPSTHTQDDLTFTIIRF